MRTVVLPNGKEVVANRLPKETYMKLRTAKTINPKRQQKRQESRRIIQEQLEEMDE